MKILIIQENGHHEANRNFRECFCLKRGFEHHGVNVDVWGKGHDTAVQNSPYLNDDPEVHPIWDAYDLIVAIENWDWMPDLSNVLVPKFIWAIDAHCKGPKVYEQYAFDKVLHATKQFAKEGCWLPNCYDDTIIYPLENSFYKRVPVGFCGNKVNRWDIIQYLQKMFSMQFDEMVIGDDMVRAINSYKVHWNANMSVDVNYRNFETMGCSTCLLTSAHPDYAELGMVNQENCLIYNNQSELHNYLKVAIEMDEWREEIAKKGYDLVKSRHTYRHRAQQMLEMI
ncbi:glycosyltransferase [Crocinitomicaceae bacterium]|nr:glycosyltransferase [Crocinitomicaceae bacterium]